MLVNNIWMSLILSYYSYVPICLPIYLVPSSGLHLGAYVTIFCLSRNVKSSVSHSISDHNPASKRYTLFLCYLDIGCSVYVRSN